MKLLFISIMLTTLISRAENIIVIFMPEAKARVISVAAEYGYPVVHDRKNAVMIRVSEESEFYSEFVLKIFQDPKVLHINRQNRGHESLLRFNLSERLNEEAVAELLARLEDVGARVHRIEKATHVELSVPHEAAGRIRQELKLRKALLENIARTHGTDSSCTLYFSK